eukprot:TRINITY_DN7537_c0_g1_i12.p2 TRINITY_DN7537_c0_g1~~TRINITY_DN7537_c0_g1_i12.p2  ORF type:complete len:182 (-),score=53.99 TRINITY_DN7537_c0_g1_i12:106-651(-)
MCIRDSINAEYMGIMKPAVKGILKKRSECPRPEGSMLKWDEHTIAEHDKDRGGKMKITEPKTPYEYNEHQEEDTAKATLENTLLNQVVTKLEKHQEKAEAMETASPEYEYMDEEEEKESEEERKRREAFKKKQKLHYKNEYAKAQLKMKQYETGEEALQPCLLYTSPSPRDLSTSRMPSSA